VAQAEACATEGKGVGETPGGTKGDGEMEHLGANGTNGPFLAATAGANLKTRYLS
jgi:hypothetical protein